VVVIQRGKVECGTIVLSEPLRLPDGTEVVVRIEPVGEAEGGAEPLTYEDLSTLPFFGMWANRDDMIDSTVWVRSQRERWQSRSGPLMKGRQKSARLSGTSNNPRTPRHGIG
jgi:hypothetical protein